MKIEDNLVTDKNINDLINGLPERDRKRVIEEYTARFNDEGWLIDNDFDYANPDVEAIKRKTYNEMFPKETVGYIN